jgi:hypothetical protein
LFPFVQTVKRSEMMRGSGSRWNIMCPNIRKPNSVTVFALNAWKNCILNLIRAKELMNPD